MFEKEDRRGKKRDLAIDRKYLVPKKDPKQKQL